MCAVNVDFLISEEVFTLKNSQQSSACFCCYPPSKNWPFVISCQAKGIM